MGPFITDSFYYFSTLILYSIIHLYNFQLIKYLRSHNMESNSRVPTLEMNGKGKEIVHQKK